MMMHSDVDAEVQHLNWQIAAWRRILERHPDEKSFVHFQIEYNQGRIQRLRELEAEVWATK